jgi:hypothetical protein
MAPPSGDQATTSQKCAGFLAADPATDQTAAGAADLGELTRANPLNASRPTDKPMRMIPEHLRDLC